MSKLINPAQLMIPKLNQNILAQITSEGSTQYLSENGAIMIKQF